jgi:hypothetical protein
MVLREKRAAFVDRASRPNLLTIHTIWRKRVGVEPTIRPAKDRITGFEGRESHRTLFASGKSIAWNHGTHRVVG